MTDLQQHYMLLACLKYGGSFYQALAQAGLLADPENRTRLLAAFPDIEILYGPKGVLYSEEL